MAEQRALRAKREELGLRQEDMAQKLGISKSYYCMLENGERRLSLELARKCARILGTTLDAVFLSPEVHETRTREASAS